MTQLWAVRRGDRWQLIMGTHSGKAYRELLIGDPMSEDSALAYLKAHHAPAP